MSLPFRFMRISTSPEYLIAISSYRIIQGDRRMEVIGLEDTTVVFIALVGAVVGS